jgi:ABC-type multidrug transport system ATPase subunit
VSDLSGGERRRLQLTRLLMDEPNVLLLDEPTNDLDIETLTSLEDVLDGWAGTLLVVSHDRYLLERVCDRQVALMGDGKVRDLPGGVEQYLELRHSASPSHANHELAPARLAPTHDLHGSATGEAGGAGGVGGPSAAELREPRKDMARIETQLTRLGQRQARIHTAMADAATDHAKVLELNRQLREVVDEREALELEWLAAAEVVG